MKREALRESGLVGNKIELPTPCKKHVVYYPAALALRAVHEQTYAVFMTSCECGEGYIVALEPDGAHFRVHGDAATIGDLYETLPWPESDEIQGEQYFFKTPPNVAAIHERFSGPS